MSGLDRCPLWSGSGTFRRALSRKNSDYLMAGYCGGTNSPLIAGFDRVARVISHNTPGTDPNLLMEAGCCSFFPRQKSDWRRHS